jgi:hypothetical protein
MSTANCFGASEQACPYYVPYAHLHHHHHPTTHVLAEDVANTCTRSGVYMAIVHVAYVSRSKPHEQHGEVVEEEGWVSLEHH